jgi:hypothetical protein
MASNAGASGPSTSRRQTRRKTDGMIPPQVRQRLEAWPWVRVVRRHVVGVPGIKTTRAVAPGGRAAHPPVGVPPEFPVWAVKYRSYQLVETACVAFFNRAISRSGALSQLAPGCDGWLVQLRSRAVPCMHGGPAVCNLASVDSLVPMSAVSARYLRARIDQPTVAPDDLTDGPAGSRRGTRSRSESDPLPGESPASLRRRHAARLTHLGLRAIGREPHRPWPFRSYRAVAR